MSAIQAKPGDVIRFEGCTWHDGWDFDAPLIIYSPVQRYCMTGSICKESVLREVESLAIDLCLSGSVESDFNADDLKEFKWRGWNPSRFKKRKAATHARFDVRFFGAPDDLEFEILEIA